MSNVKTQLAAAGTQISVSSGGNTRGKTSPPETAAGVKQNLALWQSGHLGGKLNKKKTLLFWEKYPAWHLLFLPGAILQPACGDLLRGVSFLGESIPRRWQPRAPFNCWIISELLKSSRSLRFMGVDSFGEQDSQPNVGKKKKKRG